MDGVFKRCKIQKFRLPSAIYVHYEGDRITQSGRPFIDSTKWRQYILKKIQIRLEELDELTPIRRHKLIQYYYKDSKVLCELDSALWKATYKRCQALDPMYTPEETDPIAGFCVSLFGTYHGICWFVRIRRIARLIGLRRRFYKT